MTVRKKAAAYVRVSTMEQAKEGNSIKAQTDKLKSYIKVMDMDLIKVYTDPAESGASLNRPALQEMLKDINEGKINAVVVYKLDRLSRSQKNTLYLIEDVFLKNQVDFISMQENFDTSTPFGRAMIGIISTFAQLERDMISERMTMGRIERAKKGLYTGGGNVNFGYRYLPDQDALVPDDYEATIVNDVFDLFIVGNSITSIVQKLRNKYPSKRKSIHDNAVRRWLRNETYIGKLKYNKNVYFGKHVPIVQKEKFERAQELLKHRTHGNAFVRKYLLSGLLRCGACGNRYSAYESRSKASTGKVYINRYYRCNSRTWKYTQETGEKCCNPNLKIEKLDKLVLEKVKQFGFENAQQRVEKSKNDVNLKLYQKKLSDIENRISKLVDLYSFDKIPLSMLESKTAELNLEKEELRSLIDKEDNYYTSEQFDELIEDINAFDFDNASNEAIRSIISKIVKEIIINEDSIQIIFYD